MRPGDVEMTTRFMPLMLVAAFLACGSGCAKSDWIQDTLVTVDVTGVWVGSINQATSTLYVKLELEQHGPKVGGTLRVMSAGTSGSTGTLGSGPIEGTVSGDVLSVKRTNGSFSAEMSVNGDEMTGRSGNRPISLHRASSSAKP